MTRPTTRTSETATPGDEAASPHKESVRIRMYGQGLGDCFLLSLPRVGSTGDDRDGQPVHVLIDCGAIMGTPDDAERLQRIVKDIATTTHGHLDLLVITHEHWDHLSGFLKAQNEWDEITIHGLWMAWTEKDDPDGLPGVLKRILEKQRLALTKVSDYALRFGLEGDQPLAVSLMSFLSDAPVDGQSFSASSSAADAFAAARQRVAADKHVFCEPGEIRAIPGTEAVCYALGPPRSDARLRQTGPSRERETYDLQIASIGAGEGQATSAQRRLERRQLLEARNAALSLRAMEENRSSFNAFAMPLLGPSMLTVDGAHHAASGDDSATERQAEADWESYEQSFPFAASWRVSLSDAQRAASEYPSAYPALASYCDDVYHWRRIDFDWLAGASDFALQADNLTNNTSLVLAIELPSSGEKRPVLLFVGDAQVGNWLSWDDIEEWTPRDGAVAAQATPDIAELLGRVVFYKVGHHGSHNATLKRQGLERMPGDASVTAFVPVSIPVAHEIKHWTEMPLESMMDALAQRTGGKVVLPDGTLWPKSDTTELAEALKAIGVSVSSEKLPAKTRVRQGRNIELEPPVPLWVELATEY